MPLYKRSETPFNLSLVPDVGPPEPERLEPAPEPKQRAKPTRRAQKQENPQLKIVKTTPKPEPAETPAPVPLPAVEPPAPTLSEVTSAEAISEETTSAEIIAVLKETASARAETTSAEMPSVAGFWVAYTETILFDLLPRLEERSDMIVFFMLYGLCWGTKGHRSGRYKIRHPELGKLCKMTGRQVQTSTGRLAAQGYIRRLDPGGTTSIPEYEMIVPAKFVKNAETGRLASEVISAPKEKRDKEIRKGDSRAALGTKPDPACPLCFGSGFEQGERGVKGKCPRCR